MTPPNTDRNLLALALGASQRKKNGHAWSAKVESVLSLLQEIANGESRARETSVERELAPSNR